MNKQEAIRELMSKSREIIFGDDENVYLSRKRTIELVSQIEEPQKPVVPKFVAEWLEKSDWRKDTLGRQTIFGVFDNLTLDASNGFYVDVKKWVEENGNIFAQAWVFGYEIEQEKLYTVEIPDPHGMYKIRYLFRNITGNICIGATNYRDIFLDEDTHLTESEIKKDFEWAWDAGFAKEVEEK